MTISLIFNIVTFVCACVIFYNFRKAMRLYRKRCDMYDKLYKDYTELEMKNRDLFFEKNGLEFEVLKLKETVRGLDLTENMDCIGDFKNKIRAITKEYEKQNCCHIDRMVLLGEDSSYSHKRVYVEM